MIIQILESFFGIKYLIYLNKFYFIIVILTTSLIIFVVCCSIELLRKKIFDRFIDRMLTKISNKIKKERDDIE